MRQSRTPLESKAGPTLTEKPTTVVSVLSHSLYVARTLLGELSQDSVGDFLSSAKEASHLCPELMEEKGAGLSGRKDLSVETVVTRSSHVLRDLEPGLPGLHIWHSDGSTVVLTHAQLPNRACPFPTFHS